MTSVVDCVGVLSKNPHLALFEEGGEEGKMMGDSVAERSATCPPHTLIPRLHCISVTTLSHCNPLLPRDLPHPLPAKGRLHCVYSGGHCATLISYSEIMSCPFLDAFESESYVYVADIYILYSFTQCTTVSLRPWLSHVTFSCPS